MHSGIVIVNLNRCEVDEFSFMITFTRVITGLSTPNRYVLHVASVGSDPERGMINGHICIPKNFVKFADELELFDSRRMSVHQLIDGSSE